MLKYFTSLAARLTVWYAGIYGLSFLIVFGAFYFIMQKAVYRWTDEELEELVGEFTQVYGRLGFAEVTRMLETENREEKERFLARIIDKENRVVFDVGAKDLARVELSRKSILAARAGQKTRQTVGLAADQHVRLLYSPLSNDLVIQIGMTPREHEQWMRELPIALMKVTLLGLLLAMAAGGFLAHRGLAPIREMARMASEISGQSQGRRMPVSGRGDEVDQLAESFNSMLERIDNLIHGLREVTQTLAHDLRTPITGIRGMAEVTLRTGRDPEAYRMTLYRIMEQLDRLLGLSNIILDVAEAEAGALVLRHEPVQLHELAWDLMQTFEPVAEDKGLRIDASIFPNLIVTGDPARLAQVFANLLDNAIKYTPGGGHILLSLEVNPTGDGIVITVADDGVGISEKDLPHVFERHYRGEKSLSRPGSGSGLGLTLVRGIVENHGGHVIVDSQLGKGSTFRVFLPFG